MRPVAVREHESRLARMGRPTPSSWSKWAFVGGDRWADWSFFSSENIARVTEGAGAYALGMRRRPISRMLGTDAAGVLDVGEGGELRSRLQQLLACVSTPGTTGHMAGWRLGTIGLMAKLGVSPRDLRFTWCPANSKDEAYRLEGTLLRYYFTAFGELPPLNYKFNWAVWGE